MFLLGFPASAAAAAISSAALDARVELCAALELSAPARPPGALFRDDGSEYARALRAPRLAGHPAVATYSARLARGGDGEVMLSGPVVELLLCLDADLRPRRDEPCRRLPFPLAAADFAAKARLVETLSAARPLPASTTGYAAAADARLAALADFSGGALPENRLALSPLLDPARAGSASDAGAVTTVAPVAVELSTSPEHETTLTSPAALSLWTSNAEALAAALPDPGAAVASALKSAYESRPGACAGDWRACAKADLSATMAEAALAWARAQGRVAAFGENASIGPRRGHLEPLRARWKLFAAAAPRPSLAAAAPGFYAALVEGLAASPAAPASAPAAAPAAEDPALREAIELYRKGDARAALERLRGGAALTRGDPEAAITEAVLLGATGRGADAVRAADAAVAKARSDAFVSVELLRSLLSTRASLRRGAGDAGGAARDLEEVRLLDSAPSAP